MEVQQCMELTVTNRSQACPGIRFKGLELGEEMIYEQAIGLLVTVSSMPHGTSTSVLSTPYSPGGLSESLPWTSHLEEGFTLRCLQRLSHPGLAILPWGGRPNRSTSDPSIPVLSY